MRRLRMKCSSCGHWKRVPVNKVFVERNTPEPKVKAYIPMYKPLEVSKCEKCGKVIAEPKELIRIFEGKNKIYQAVYSTSTFSNFRFTSSYPHISHR